MEKMDFCSDWQFGKQGAPSTQAVTLPHDAMILEQRDPESPGGSAVGFFPPGVYEYSKTFSVPLEWKDQQVTLQFEGVYKNCVVSINGQQAGGCAYGYVPFFVQTDGLLKYGEQNTIAVTANNGDMPNSRWYTGAGIYRPVWLWVGGQNRIEIEGVKISTLLHSPARLCVNTAVVGSGDVAVDIFYQGTRVASASGASVELNIPDAHLWSDENPELYECRVTLTNGDDVLDEVSETFGIRSLEWSAKGFLVNGKQTLLRGGCVHHDNGILGARCYDKSEWRRVNIMKTAGFNAIRISHNPASTAMLNACDRLGVYVIDETWDMWYNHKSKHDYATDFMENYQQDLRAMVHRDYNHPSVIMYSIGNEVSEPAKQEGVQLTKEMVRLIHSLDNTRPVTAGLNLMIIHKSATGEGIYNEEGGRNNAEQTNKFSGMSSTMFNMMTQMVGTGMNKAANSDKADKSTTPCLDALDIAGYNYGSGRYAKEGMLHPDRLIYGSETFPPDIAKNWAMVKKYPYLIGDFMWTAWDYLGESGVGAWAYTSDGKGFDKPYPWLLADTGVLDILGTPNAELFLAQAAWGLLEKPAIGVQPVNHPGVKPAKMVWRGSNAMPSWAWQNCEGNAAVVEVYTDAHAVELTLGAKRLGKKRVKNCLATFKTKYAPSMLSAVAFDAEGREVSRSELAPANGKISIQARPEENTATVGDVVYVAVQLVGENGVVESNADARLSVSVQNGELLAFGSANPRTPENYNVGSFTTYYGRAQAVVRATAPGNLTLCVKDETGRKTTAVIEITTA